jgi:hypothetical protein
LGASFVALAAQTSTSIGGGSCLLLDCSAGDIHYFLGHYDALGETTVDTSIYATDNINDTNLSWKIVTTANVSYATPYRSPWFPAYNDNTSTAITPSLEIVRSGSATAYKDDEVWSEWLYPGTSGYPKAVLVSDARGLVATAADQTTGALGASDWSGENATSWFGKLAPTASFTPSEVGHIQARVCVGKASSTVYVDPQIRGLA